MNSKLTWLTLACSSALACSAFAGEKDDGISPFKPIVGQERLKLERAIKMRTDSLYFVQLEDQSLASYQGGVSGLTATSIQNVQQSNKTAKGMLNVQSSASKNYLYYLDNKQQQFLQSAKSTLGHRLNVKQHYKIVLNAMAIQLSPAEAKALKKQKGVKKVAPVGMHYIQTDSGPKHINANKVWQGVDNYTSTKGEGVIVGIIDTGINPEHPSFADIGGDGYDHTNPLGEGNYLGDCQQYSQFCNDKLIGIISYPEIIDNYPTITDEKYDYLGDELKVGWDFASHGSHVASTAAGNVVNNVPVYMSVTDGDGSVISGKTNFTYDSISGVAPHANIVSYQVCAPGGSAQEGCFPDLTLRAIEHAIENGINVMNYSVGGSATDPWSSLDALAFLNARAAGIHIATSAGNSGPDAGTIGAPGNSPWITTVAAYSHSRGFSDQLLSDFSGGDTTAPSSLTGKGATIGYSANVVLASDYDNAGCLIEFEAGTFNGEIVVCERGDIARVAKGRNVLAGGAGGLILINIEGGSDSVNADFHLVPAVHLSTSDGTTLVEWLSTGSNHQATINGSEMISDPELADIAGYFTSRGPNKPYSEIFAPDVAGPGVDIYAANSEDHPFHAGTLETPYTTMSGTSMSSPHVAGALALIYSVHPDWTPAQAQSALMTTAISVTYKDDDFTGEKVRSDFFDMGAGSIRIDRAIKAGLLLNETKENYLAADPSIGGEPSSLNLSSMVKEKCIVTCSWTRTLTATEDAQWTASYDYLGAGMEITVSPASFSLTKGQAIELTISTTANEQLTTEWSHGFVVLTPNKSSIVESRLQVLAQFAGGMMPENISGVINSANKTLVIAGIETIGTDSLTAAGFGLFKAERFTGTAVGDTDEVKMLKDMDTVFAVQVNVPAYTKNLIVEITKTDAPDMDLYVGIDENNDGLPDQLELFYSLTCLSGNIDSNEKCEIKNPLPGIYWVFAHNFTGTAVGVADEVELAITKVAFTYEPSFDIDAPTVVDRAEVFDINLTVNGALGSNGIEPLEEGALYYGQFELGLSSTFKRNIGTAIIAVTGGESAPYFTSIEESILAGELIHYQINLPSNTATNERTFTIEVNIPLGLSYQEDSAGGTFADNKVTWQITQSAGEEALVIDLNLLSAVDSANSSVSLSAAYGKNGSELTAFDSKPIEIEALVKALINGKEVEEISVEEGAANLSLSASDSIPAKDGDVLTYSWTQTSGPTLALSATDQAAVSFATPNNISAQSQYSYEVSVSNGRSTDIATVTFTVTPEPEPEPAPEPTPVPEPSPAPEKSSGGSASFGLFALSLLWLGRRKLSN
ncbi:S8 family serine peptidase [Colwellia piezophila]|uniref:S8 family serine peptidase n=1 Tax=Colwellia piezophila TaxID=211668 RepID=UPI000376B999|nr:S8 family serine peptidase [Colwellia piezophila]